MKFSLLVATLNRCNELDFLLESLCQQKYKNFEVFIADQNEKNFLAPLRKKYLDKHNIKFIRVENKGVSNARNAIIPYASGAFIAFPDDDCFYLPHTLERIKNYFEKNKDLDGLMVGWAESIEPAPENKDYDTNKLDIYSAIQFSGTLVQFYRSATIKNIFFDRSLGPSPRNKQLSGEDSDFLIQVLKQNNKVGKTDEILICHAKPNFSLDSGCKNKVKGYALGRMRILKKHKYPLWFQWANILYPLIMIPVEKFRSCKYRLLMSYWRFRGLFTPYE